LAIGAAGLVGVQVGAALVASRFVVDQLDAATLTVLRYMIGSACLVPLAFGPARVSVASSDRLPIALIGVIQFGAVVALLNLALTWLAAGPVALIFATFTVQTMALAAAFGHERWDRRRGFGVATTLAGVAIALADRLDGPLGGQTAWAGALAAFASAFAGALCTVLYRPYLGRYPPLAVGARAMLASVLALAPVAVASGGLAQLPAVTASGWLAVSFIGLSSAAGYWLWLWALRRISATEVTVFLGLSPVTAGLLGAWLLAEPVTPALAAGTLLVLTGLWIATRRPTVVAP
jgi:drug/metabolite transporter (DMT)-like permease